MRGLAEADPRRARAARDHFMVAILVVVSCKSARISDDGYMISLYIGPYLVKFVDHCRCSMICNERLTKRRSYSPLKLWVE